MKFWITPWLICTLVLAACGKGDQPAEVADEVEGAICNDPEAAISGDLSSCTFKVRMVEAREDMYGPDRVGGTIQYLPAE